VAHESDIDRLARNGENEALSVSAYGGDAVATMSLCFGLLRLLGAHSTG
jgi:hypothetical protein